jgi:hypothetical protein
VIERVETHPHNDEWVVGYTIVERDDAEEQEARRASLRQAGQHRALATLTRRLTTRNAGGYARVATYDVA